MRQAHRFTQLPAEQREIVFYSEGEAYWPHLQPILDSLINDHRRQVTYISSSPSDPGLTYHPDILGFEIGDGTARTFLFRSMDARILVLSMPDLDTFHIKRSVRPVHYVYVHHSLASLHTVYRKGAFNSFDTMFCAGPHHVAEMQETCAVYNLKKMDLFEHGYGRLDTLLNSRRDHPPARSRTAPNVLVAPSWGDNGLLEIHGARLAKILIDAGLKTTIRPHHETVRRTPKGIAELKALSDGSSLLSFDDKPSSMESLLQCNVMISDWSGVAIEGALGMGMPVLFVDVPQKIRNEESSRIDCVPFEKMIRDEVGEVLAPENLTDAPELLHNLVNKELKSADLMRKWVFNPGSSGKAGADKLIHILRTLQS